MKKLMCILLVGALSLPLAAGERISRSENFTGVKYLVVKEVSGDINVKGASGKKLSASVSYNEKAGEDYEPIFEKKGNSLYLTGDYKSKKKRMSLTDPNAKWEITLPANVELMVHNVSGDIQCSSLNNSSDITAVSGDIKISDCSGKIEAESTSGDIKAENLKGNLRAKAISGDLTIKNVKQADYLESVSGKIDVNDSDVEKISSVSGNITLEKCAKLRSIHSVSGNVYASETEGLSKSRFHTVSGSLRTQ
jgi:DUF4097 and DUF4098 domain-containing protein YvlB